jgi:hypothetical protein
MGSTARTGFQASSRRAELFLDRADGPLTGTSGHFTSTMGIGDATSSPLRPKARSALSPTAESSLAARLDRRARSAISRSAEKPDRALRRAASDRGYVSCERFLLLPACELSRIDAKRLITPVQPRWRSFVSSLSRDSLLVRGRGSWPTLGAGVASSARVLQPWSPSQLRALVGIVPPAASPVPSSVDGPP